MEQKYIFPFSVLVNVLVRWCGVSPWLCDMYLLNVVLLVHYLTAHQQEEDAGGSTSVSNPTGGEQLQRASRRMYLDLSGYPGGAVSLSFRPDGVQTRSGKARRCRCEDDAACCQDSSSGRGEVSAHQQRQHPPPAPAAATNGRHTPVVAEGKAMNPQEEDTPPPGPPAGLIPPESLLPGQRVAHTRAQAARRERCRAREFAGRK